MQDMTPAPPQPAISQYHDAQLGDFDYAGYYPLKVEELRGEPSRFYLAVRVDAPITQAFCDDIICDPPQEHPKGGVILFETHGEKNAVRVVSMNELMQGFFKTDGIPIDTCDVPRMPLRPAYVGQRITVQTRRPSIAPAPE